MQITNCYYLHPKGPPNKIWYTNLLKLTIMNWNCALGTSSGDPLFTQVLSVKTIPPFFSPVELTWLVSPYQPQFAPRKRDFFQEYLFNDDEKSKHKWQTYLCDCFSSNKCKCNPRETHTRTQTHCLLLFITTASGVHLLHRTQKSWEGRKCPIDIQRNEAGSRQNTSDHNTRCLINV